MIVVFTWVGADLSIPSLLVASVRKAMPDAEIVQCSDEDTQAVAGVTHVRRLPLASMDHLMLHRVAHLAAFDEPTLLLDADALVLQDVRWLFTRMGRQGVDVALTTRDTMPVPPPGFAGFPEFTGKDIAGVMPYNTGAVFCRQPQLWRDAYVACAELEPRWWRWFGDQRALALAIERGGYSVRALTPAVNYTPKSVEDDTRASIVQYKGPKRKPWMAVHAERFGITV